MAKIEVVFNDDSRLRGIFWDIHDAASFFVSAVHCLKLDEEDYEDFQIVVDGVEFGPPGPRHIYLENDYLWPRSAKVQKCVDHIEHCIEVKETFFDD